MPKLRMGMIGGGEGSFIGAVHRIAAELDGQIELVGGAFSSDPERSKRSGEALYGLPSDRCYGSFEELLASESSLRSEDRVHFIVIATPNHVHYAHAKAALEAGFHVMSDKPMTYSLDEALDLRDTVDRTGKVFGLTHNYTGYPMIKEARHLVRGGAFGKVRRINIEYIQGWLSTPEEAGGNKQAEWRTDPARSGCSRMYGRYRHPRRESGGVCNGIAD